jgi:hypothetical protein
MRHVFALTLSVLCTISLIAAQTPAQQPSVPRNPGQESAKPATPATPATPAAPAAQAAQANKVTYTGCLKPGTTPDSWLLENAEVASAASTKAPAATGTSGVAASKATLGLTVKPGENLKPHANHKIEVTGTLIPGAKMSGEAAAGAAATAPRQGFTVESFKMVSATCP